MSESGCIPNISALIQRKQAKNEAVRRDCLNASFTRMVKAESMALANNYTGGETANSRRVNEHHDLALSSLVRAKLGLQSNFSERFPFALLYVDKFFGADQS